MTVLSHAILTGQVHQVAKHFCEPPLLFFAESQWYNPLSGLSHKPANKKILQCQYIISADLIFWYNLELYSKKKSIICQYTGRQFPHPINPTTHFTSPAQIQYQRI